MRMRKKPEGLTPLELEIMQVLWQTGPANVQAVQQQLGRPLAYTTVQTMLNVLHRKNKVKRTLKDKAYFYRPAVSHNQARGHAVTELVERMFGGSAENLIMSLVETKQLTPERLAKLQKMVQRAAKDDQPD